MTLTFHLRGRRGTCGTGLALVARLGALGRPGRCATLRGQHGTWCHLRGRRGAWPSICVAGVAFGDIDLSFAWQAWHFWHWGWPCGTSPHTIFTHQHLSHTTVSHTPSFTHHLSPTIFHTQLCHTPFLTHRFVTHHLSHTIFHHTIFHIQLCHTHTHLSPHHLSHTTLSHTIFHTQLCHTLSFTHNFHTPHLSHTTLSYTPSFFVTHYLSHTTLSHALLSRTTFTHPIFHTQLCHTHHLSLSHTIFHIQLCHTQPFFTRRSFNTSFVFPSPSRYNICCSLLEEVDLWGYPVL